MRAPATCSVSGIGDIPMLTVEEYGTEITAWDASPTACSVAPLVMFGLGPVFAMMIGPRIATRAQRPRLRRSVLGLDLTLAVAVGALCWLIGWQDFVLVWGPASLIAGSAGIWLFYVQHQFEEVAGRTPSSGRSWMPRSEAVPT